MNSLLKIDIGLVLERTMIDFMSGFCSGLYKLEAILHAYLENRLTSKILFINWSSKQHVEVIMEITER